MGEEGGAQTGLGGPVHEVVLLALLPAHRALGPAQRGGRVDPPADLPLQHQDRAPEAGAGHPAGQGPHAGARGQDEAEAGERVVHQMILQREKFLMNS